MTLGRCHMPDRISESYGVARSQRRRRLDAAVVDPRSVPRPEVLDDRSAAAYIGLDGGVAPRNLGVGEVHVAALATDRPRQHRERSPRCRTDLPEDQWNFVLAFRRHDL